MVSIALKGGEQGCMHACGRPAAHAGHGVRSHTAIRRLLLCSASLLVLLCPALPLRGGLRRHRAGGVPARHRGCRARLARDRRARHRCVPAAFPLLQQRLHGMIATWCRQHNGSRGDLYRARAADGGRGMMAVVLLQAAGARWARACCACWRTCCPPGALCSSWPRSSRPLPSASWCPPCRRARAGCSPSAARRAAHLRFLPALQLSDNRTHPCVPLPSALCSTSLPSTSGQRIPLAIPGFTPLALRQTDACLVFDMQDVLCARALCIAAYLLSCTLLSMYKEHNLIHYLFHIYVYMISLTLLP